MKKQDVIIIGAGAAGLMCAIEAGKRGRKVLVIEHSNKPGKKILMSGGGRCNFTNLYTSPENYLSHNSHFCRSALSRYQPSDFVDLVSHYKIAYHEKARGQLFCDHQSKDILNMLLQACQQVNVEITLHTSVSHIALSSSNYFQLNTSHGQYVCDSLVIATGGLSIPTMGASPFGYQVAEQFDIKVWPTRAGLVPFTLQPSDKERLSPLSGVSAWCVVACQQHAFRENMLLTHRGLSGPAMLQISSYWMAGDFLTIDLLPELDLLTLLLNQHPNTQLKNVLGAHLPKRLVERWLGEFKERTIQSCSRKQLQTMVNAFKNWRIKPNNTEGYRTAEVTLGGVDVDALSSKTFAVNKIPNLYFIGEVLDVTGWLGGYNFQWAWSSGYAAGQVV